MHSHQNQIPAAMPTGTPRLVSTACQGLLKRRAWGGLTLHLAFRSLSSHCLTPDAVFRGVLVVMDIVSNVNSKDGRDMLDRVRNFP